MKDRVSWKLIDFAFILLAAIIAQQLFMLMGLDYLAALVSGLGYGDAETMHFLINYLFQFVFMLTLIFFIVLVIRKGSFAELGFISIKPKQFLLYGFGGGFAVFFVVVVMGALLQSINPQIPPQTFEEIVRNAKSNYALLILFMLVTVFAPFLEEVFYRGFLYQAMRAHFNVFSSCLLAGAIFGLVHFDIWRSLPLVTGGMILCWLFEKTNNLWITILAHSSWNALVFLMLIFYMNA